MRMGDNDNLSIKIKCERQIFVIYNANPWNVSILAQQSFRAKKCKSMLFAAVFLRLSSDDSLTFPEKFLKVSECVRLGVCECSCVYTEWPRFTTFPFIYKFFDQFGNDFFFYDSSDFLVIRNLKRIFHEFL